MVGYGCTTCIGNSGPLPDAVAFQACDGPQSGSRPRCSAATATSRGASTPRVRRPTTSPRPSWSSPTRSAGGMDLDLDERAPGARRSSDAKPVYLARHLAVARKRFATRAISGEREAGGVRPALRRSVFSGDDMLEVAGPAGGGGGLSTPGTRSSSVHPANLPFFQDMPAEPAADGGHVERGPDPGHPG